MEAVIFADRIGKELYPLTKKTCVALLPITGKPVIEYAIELLVTAGIKNVFVVIADHADKVRSLLGEGKRWGISISYLTSRGQESPDAYLRRHNIPYKDGILILRGDILLNTNIKDFINLCDIGAKKAFYGRVNGKPAGICVCCCHGYSDLDILAWDNMLLQKFSGNAVPIELVDSNINYLDSLFNYHSANMDMVSDLSNKYILPGKKYAQNITIGRFSKVNYKNINAKNVFIGSNCNIDESVEFYRNVVVSDNVIIDKNVSLDNCVILPNTYVGELINIENAIVSANDLMRIDIDSIVRITDSFLLADINAITLNDKVSDLVNRALGLLMLLLSFPLWLFAVVIAIIENPKQPMNKFELRGNRTNVTSNGNTVRANFVAIQWRTSIPLLRDLPMLWPVVTGDLKLIGTLPLTPDQVNSRTETWEMLGDDAPSGLIGPTRLNLPSNAPSEEVYLCDAFYAKHRSIKQDVKYFLQGVRTLFTKRAWVKS